LLHSFRGKHCNYAGIKGTKLEIQDVVRVIPHVMKNGLLIQKLLYLHEYNNNNNNNNNNIPVNIILQNENKHIFL